MDLVIAGATAAVGCTILALVPGQIRGTDLSAIGDMTSPAFFPVLCGLGLAGLGLALGIKVFLVGSTSKIESIEDPGRVLAACLTLVLGTAAIFLLGFLLAAGGTIAAMALVFGSRRYVMVLVLAVLVPLFIHALFVGALDILLPRGLL